VRQQKEPGTWIVDEMAEAYVRLHREGYAHSVEAWDQGELAGGLYGVSLGKAFFGESMFFKKADASKIALVHLAAALAAWQFDFIDCQVKTGHLMRLGAHEEPRPVFLRRLRKALAAETRQGRWQLPAGLELPA
jgi:leucyl/phenylalanyl-tRNA--protein transferase